MNYYFPKAAEVIKRLRTTHSYSQADLAALAGLTRQTITALESGRHDPSYRTIRALAQLFNIPTMQFMKMLGGYEEERDGE